MLTRESLVLSYTQRQDLTGKTARAYVFLCGFPTEVSSLVKAVGPAWLSMSSVCRMCCLVSFRRLVATERKGKQWDSLMRTKLYCRKPHYQHLSLDYCYSTLRLLWALGTMVYVLLPVVLLLCFNRREFLSQQSYLLAFCHKDHVTEKNCDSY
jgi:hypothetical protein